MDSYTVALKSGSPHDGVYWQLSATNEKTGYSLGGIERGAAATVAYNTDIADGSTHLSVYAEVARLTNYDTVRDLNYTGLNVAWSASNVRPTAPSISHGSPASRRWELQVGRLIVRYSPVIDDVFFPPSRTPHA